jgi:hypothetical protein
VQYGLFGMTHIAETAYVFGCVISSIGTPNTAVVTMHQYSGDPTFEHFVFDVGQPRVFQYIGTTLVTAPFSMKGMWAIDTTQAPILSLLQLMISAQHS